MVELVPSVVLLALMVPVATQVTRPKFASLHNRILANDATTLVVQGTKRAKTYGTSSSQAANDPKYHI